MSVNIEIKSEGSVHLTQPHLIDQILIDLKLDKLEVKVKTTSTSSTRISSESSELEPFDESSHYRSMISKLNFLEKSRRPDISYTTHYCAIYSINPEREHGIAVRWLTKYLKGS